MEAPYGTWKSPIDGAAVAADRGWTYSLVTAAGGDVYWSEARPLEDGRDAIVVKRGDAAPVDAIPATFSARTRVHEYGGGAYTVHDGAVIFCNDADQRVYRGAEPITPEPATPFGLRYADLRVAGDRVICVRERDGEPEHVNDLVGFPLDGSAEPVVLAAGHDFYAAPRVSPDGSQLAFLTWDHPRMPWEGSELWVMEFGGEPRRVAGGPAEAIVQPEWSPDGVLHFASDRTGWWNLYRGDSEPVTAVEAEIGGALWVFGESWYAFLPDGRIVCTVSSEGSDRLAIVEDLALIYVPLELTRIVDLTTDGERALFVGASPTRSPGIVAADLETGAIERLSDDGDEIVDAAYVSVPRPLEYPTAGERTAHALFYPPHNPDFEGPADERPPLLVRVHGGPTAHVTATLSPEIQFFTSRGFAVCDVNYGGSTGYGREYRDRLRGQWGIVDTEDAVNAALALARAGEADRERMAITGGSAGGWTVLCALVFRPEVFAAGADYFGVSDLMGFVDDTHKFESRYNDWLVGPWPEAKELWRERSPINHVDELRAPVIVLQGLEDKVVPPAQSELDRCRARAQGHPARLPGLRGRAARLPQGREPAARGRGRALVLRTGPGLRARRRDRAGGDPPRIAAGVGVSTARPGRSSWISPLAHAQ